MTDGDGHEREMAKWLHLRLDAARLRAEGEQRQDLADRDEVGMRRNRYH